MRARMDGWVERQVGGRRSEWLDRQMDTQMKSMQGRGLTAEAGFGPLVPTPSLKLKALAAGASAL